jgi:hypothetical protein
MRDLEHALREAMAEDVAGVAMPPDLTERIRARYRHHRRVRAAGALAALFVFAVATPLVVTAGVGQQVDPASGPAVGDVDGVELTYLPDGLRRYPVDGYDRPGMASWRAVTARWYPEARTGPDQYEHGVRVTVYRGDGVDFTEDPQVLSHLTRPIRQVPLTSPQRRSDGRVYFRTPPFTPPEDWPFPQWIDVFWPADDGVTLRVRVSADLEDELDRIVSGIRVTGPGDRLWFDPAQQAPPAAGGLCAPETNVELRPSRLDSGWQEFGGVVLRHVPGGHDGPHLLRAVPALGLADEQSATRIWQYTYRWGSVWNMTVDVFCGDLHQHPGALHEWGLVERAAHPYALPDGRDAFRVRYRHGVDREGISIFWYERPDAVIQLRVDQRHAAELDDILAGIEVIHP